MATHWLNSEQQKNVNPVLPEIGGHVAEPEIEYGMNKIEYLMEEFLQTLNCGQLSWVRMDSGSCYTNVKVPEHYELDFMVFPDQVQCRIEPCSEHLGYCRVFITNKPELPSEFQETIGPDDELTPSKFKEYAFKLFEPIQQENPYLRRIENKSVCPAYTIEYRPDIVQNDPRLDRALMNRARPFGHSIDIDWVPCLQVQQCPGPFMEWETWMLTEQEKTGRHIYVVPKKCAANGEELELWRMSYSEFEKKIIRDKCSRVDRSVITTLKSELRKVKNEEWKLCSFHIINHCLNFFEENPKRLDDDTDLEYYRDAIGSLIRALDSKNIPHFFIPDFNLLQEVEIKECKKFIKKLKKKKKELEQLGGGRRKILRCCPPPPLKKKKKYKKTNFGHSTMTLFAAGEGGGE